MNVYEYGLWFSFFCLNPISNIPIKRKFFNNVKDCFQYMRYSGAVDGTFSIHCDGDCVSHLSEFKIFKNGFSGKASFPRYLSTDPSFDKIMSNFKSTIAYDSGGLVKAIALRYGDVSEDL